MVGQCRHEDNQTSVEGFCLLSLFLLWISGWDNRVRPQGISLCWPWVSVFTLTSLLNWLPVLWFSFRLRIAKTSLLPVKKLQLKFFYNHCCHNSLLRPSTRVHNDNDLLVHHSPWCVCVWMRFVDQSVETQPAPHTYSWGATAWAPTLSWAWLWAERCVRWTCCCHRTPCWPPVDATQKHQ